MHRNRSDFDLNQGMCVLADRDITSCKSQGGQNAHNAESGQKLRGYEDDFLSEKNRAEDILLGALGYGEGAHIISIERVAPDNLTSTCSFKGKGRYDDGEEFDFESDFDLSELDVWALGVLLKSTP